MNPWTALLESLHSALIDELVERHPKPKPELGMPVRLTEYRLPPLEWSTLQDGAPTESLVIRVEQGKGDLLQTGLASLALSKKATQALGLDARKLWDEAVKRAGGEFMRRSIQPRFSGIEVIAAGSALPKGFPAPGRVIWMPIKLGGGICCLAIGV